MSVKFLRDIMIIVASGIFSVALILLIVESLVLFRKVLRLVDVQHRSQQSVADIVNFVEQNIGGIAGLAGLIVGLKKAYEAFTRSSEKERSQERGEDG